jgi:hypothetical protein
VGIRVDHPHWIDLRRRTLLEEMKAALHPAVAVITWTFGVIVV